MANKRKQHIVKTVEPAQSTNNSSEEIWRRNPEIVRQFLQRRIDYEQLCVEVEYILRKRVTEKHIEIASITARAKTLNSFLEKLQRKSYEDPFKELTDLAAARVVCLYRSDIRIIADMVREEFDVVEDIDKLDELGVDQFGYGARHFLLRLGKTSSGARYDDLKQLICEVQVRTVVQDAWAIIQHHMVYKREAQVPTHLQRKLNSLAGLFETVDDQFERIREERQAYLTEVRDSLQRPDAFLENELNLDSIKEYLKWRFPGRGLEAWDGQTRMVLDALLAADLKTLRDVDSIVSSTASRRQAVVRELEATLPPKRAEDGTLPANIEIALALALTAPEGRTSIPFGPVWVDIISRHRAA